MQQFNDFSSAFARDVSPGLSSMHYSQLRSDVTSTVEPGCGNADLLRLQLQGFIDVGMLSERLGDLIHRIEHHAPDAVLCDLRTVSGYGPGTPALAREWFMLACRAGIRRVALVATSSVLRTAALALSHNLNLELCCFSGEAQALRWLGEQNNAMPSSSTTSSSVGSGARDARDVNDLQLVSGRVE
ncbi:STAS/SEC14 domain-containing protein [Enhygromyxa salina]|uniref:STAS/SEC14 domain-containing protein n=1 Tax=Enhygromyxa salina TaxID=215803 RepID=UPI0011BA5681|nr:STAS/SEC14 domain-containing protein [Enhygromyxa salina]